MLKIATDIKENFQSDRMSKLILAVTNEVAELLYPNYLVHFFI